MERELPQSEKFKQAAREHGADVNEKRWKERLKKIAKKADKQSSSE